MSNGQAVKSAEKAELDAIVADSLRSFYRQIGPDWWGRENEMVNLYAFSHLARYVREGTVLSDLGQIGIEVTVRQLPPNEDHKGRRGTVRKDLVIWPRAGMTLWKDGIPCNEPLAVMEWKANHFLNSRVHQKNWADYREDVNWLRETSAREGMGSFIGYAVMVENTQVSKTLTCVKIYAGADEQLLKLPDDAT